MATAQYAQIKDSIFYSAISCGTSNLYPLPKTDDGSEFVRVIQVADYEKGKLTFTASFFEDGSVAGFKLAQ